MFFNVYYGTSLCQNRKSWINTDLPDFFLALQKIFFTLSVWWNFDKMLLNEYYYVKIIHYNMISIFRPISCAFS